MFRLVALLCACLFAALLIAGKDTGQLRPGLAKATAEGTPIVMIERKFSAPVQMSEAPLIAPSDALPPPIEVAAPVEAQPRSAAPKPEQRVFTLSHLTESTADLPPPSEEEVSAETPLPDSANETANAANSDLGGWIELPDQVDATNADAIANPDTFIASQDPYLTTQQPYGLDARFAPAPQSDAQPEMGADDTFGSEATDPFEASVWYVRADQVNVRQSPSTSAPVVDRLVNGEAVTVLGDTSGSWVRVSIQGDGIEGWVSKRLLNRY